MTKDDAPVARAAGAFAMRAVHPRACGERALRDLAFSHPGVVKNLTAIDHAFKRSDQPVGETKGHSVSRQVSNGFDSAVFEVFNDRAQALFESLRHTHTTLRASKSPAAVWRRAH